MQAEVPKQGLPHQLHLNCFAPHEILVWEEDDRRKTLRKEQRTPKAPRRFWVKEDSATRSLFDSLDLTVLDNPLGGPSDGNELNCEADPLREEVVVGAGQNLTGEEPGETWSDQAVEELHEAVLHYSLKTLQARGNGAEKSEVLEWIFAPQPMVATLRDKAGHPVEVVLPQSLTPFSFEQCCRICGYSSERLMDGLRPVLSAMGLGNVFNEIANGNNNHFETDRDAADVQRSRNLQPA